MSIVRALEIARIALLLLPFYLSLPQAARADTVTTEETVEYEDGADDTPPAPNPAALARFGSFTVLSPSLVELNGAIGEESIADFKAMLKAWPGIATMNMVDCPGTENDEANLQIARMIRAHRIATHVPASGSVRSGGVELFLAGVRRTADQGAEFGVHSWIDAEGREAKDVPANDPVHASYVRYYQEMGFTPDQARAFYAFTNATRFDNVHYMTSPELARFQILN